MLEQNLLDDIRKPKFRKPFHKVLEGILTLGHSSIFLFFLYQIFLIGYLTADIIEEFIFILFSTIALAYTYYWHKGKRIKLNI